MTETTNRDGLLDETRRARRPADPQQRRRAVLRAAVAIACGLIGLLMVAQVRATEGIGDRLAIEREENLARILSELTAQSDRLQSEITELRLTLVEFETSAEAEDVALRSLQRRFDDLRVLIGAAPAEGQGVVLRVADQSGRVTQDLLVDTVQELRDAGAEAIAVNDVRLVASSAFSTRNERLVLDGQPIGPPYRLAAIGPADTMASALEIPGGALDALRVIPGVAADVSTRDEMDVPAVADVGAFVYATPVADEDV